MKCPCCGNEMTVGFVQSTRRIRFTTEKNESWFDLCEMLQLQPKDEIVLSFDNWTHPTCIAYHCSDCKKVLIDYLESTN